MFIPMYHQRDWKHWRTPLKGTVPWQMTWVKNLSNSRGNKPNLPFFNLWLEGVSWCKVIILLFEVKRVSGYVLLWSKAINVKPYTILILWNPYERKSSYSNQIRQKVLVFPYFTSVVRNSHLTNKPEANGSHKNMFIVWRGMRRKNNLRLK